MNLKRFFYFCFDFAGFLYLGLTFAVFYFFSIARNNPIAPALGAGWFLFSVFLLLQMTGEITKAERSVWLDRILTSICFLAVWVLNVVLAGAGLGLLGCGLSSLSWKPTLLGSLAIAAVYLISFIVRRHFAKQERLHNNE